ncbi:MAG: BadF/BadG/BcrA/BcrD ATPase family protein [Actinomycetota bacterium]
MARRPAILAIDGGGSKVDVAILRRDGTVLGAARVRLGDLDGRTWQVMPHVDEHHLMPVGFAINEAARRAGVDPKRGPIADLGVYCLAGADLPTDDRRLLRWIRANGWSENEVLRNDTFAVLRAGTDRSWGVGVVCGYGTNCSAVAPDGRITRFPAIGPISGDWGGGGDLGGIAAWHAIRSEDGRGAKTTLEQAVPRHFGLKRPRQLMESIYFGRIDEQRLAELAPVLFQVALEGDTVAREVIDRQADEVVTMAGTAIRRLHMQRLDVEVVLGGGVFRNGDHAFFDRIGAGLREVAPAAHVRVLTAPPVVGAAMMGLDRLGASKAAQSRVRNALTHERLGNDTLVRRKER